MIIRLTVALILVLGAFTRIEARWERYSPFPEGQAPAAFPIAVYRKLEIPFEGTVRFERSDGTPSPLAITDVETGFHFTVGEFTEHPDYSIVAPGCMVGAISAGEADLNGDGKPDYVIVTYSGGCGLAAQASWATFVLSSPKGYHGQILPAYDAALEDLVDVDGDGRPEYLHEFFVQNVDADGMPHSYWTFNLVGFDADTLVPANKRAPGFPRWVWYTIRPNHRILTRLTLEQKRQIWTAEMSDDKAHWFGSDFSFLRQLDSAY